MNGSQAQLKQHNITDLRTINDQDFLNRIAARGRKNISVLPINSEPSTGIVEYRVVLNQFSLQLRVLHVLRNVEPIENESSILGTGGFGSVRASEWDSRYIAIKRQNFYVQSNFYTHLKFIQQVGERTFKQNSFCSEFRDYLIELSIAKLCSAYQMGSAVITEFGFDAVCYNDCFEFFQELCGNVKISCPEELEQLEHDIRGCMEFLHMELGVAHCDIKPLNIMHSPTYKKFVLIDFGSCEVVDDNFVVYTTFRGTKGYWSEEMKKLYKKVNKKPSWDYVDLRENDCVCLEKSINNFYRNQEDSEEEQQQGIRYLEPKKICNEFTLFNLMYTLRSCRNQRDAQAIEWKIDVVETLTYCINKGLFLEVANWVIGRLKELGKTPDLDTSFTSIKALMESRAKKRSSAEIESEQLYFEYITSLRFEGFTRRLKTLAAKLRKIYQYSLLIPEVSEEQMQKAIQLYQKDSTMISFDDNNKIRLKGSYVFSTLARDLADIEQNQFSLRVELLRGSSPKSVVSLKLYHLLFLKFNSLFSFDDKLVVLQEMEKLQVERKQELCLLELFKVVYMFNFDQRETQLVRLENSLRRLRLIHKRDDYYYCLALEEVSKVYELMGNSQQAETLLNESIMLFQDRYKNEYHSLMEVRYFRLAELKLNQGCYEHAKSLYDKIIEINQRLNRSQNSLSAVMLKSKLCLYQRATAELPGCIQEVKQQLREHFSEAHPCILRLNTIMLLREKIPINVKESGLFAILKQFLQGLNMETEDDYIDYCQRRKTQYGSVRQYEVFKLIISGLYEISIEKSEFRRAEMYLRKMITVEPGVLLQYYIPLTKLKISIMDFPGAKECLEKSRQLLKKENYPDKSYYPVALRCLEVRFELVFNNDFKGAKRMLAGLMNDKSLTEARTDAFEIRIWMAKLHSLQKQYAEALSLLEQARDCEEQQERPRAAVLAELELEISELYLRIRKGYNSTTFHLDLANEKLAQEHGEKHRFHFRYPLLLQAKALYYYAIDVEQARSKALQCLKLFSLFGSARGDLLAVYFLLSKIEQSRGQYSDAVKYCYRATKIALTLHKQTHPNVQQCFTRISQLYESMLKKCICNQKNLIRASYDLFQGLRQGLCILNRSGTHSSEKGGNSLYSFTYRFSEMNDNLLVDSQEFRLRAMSEFMKLTHHITNGCENDSEIIGLIAIEKRVLRMIMRNNRKFKSMSKMYYHQLQSLYRLSVYYEKLDAEELSHQIFYEKRFFRMVPQKYREELRKQMEALRKTG